MGDREDLAYLAGMVDADGFVGIQRVKRPQRFYYNARIGITGTRREPHDLAASVFGGNVTTARSRDSLGFLWSRAGTRAVPAIEALLPYLRIKREQAELALQLQESVVIEPMLWPITFASSHDDLYEESKALSVRKGGRIPGRRAAP